MIDVRGKLDIVNLFISILLFIGVVLHESELRSRLNALEAASKAHNKPQECHFTRVVDTTYYLRSHSRDTILHVQYR